MPASGISAGVLITSLSIPPAGRGWWGRISLMTSRDQIIARSSLISSDVLLLLNLEWGDNHGFYSEPFAKYPTLCRSKWREISCSTLFVLVFCRSCSWFFKNRICKRYSSHPSGLDYYGKSSPCRYSGKQENKSLYKNLQFRIHAYFLSGFANYFFGKPDFFLGNVKFCFQSSHFAAQNFLNFYQNHCGATLTSFILRIFFVNNLWQVLERKISGQV